MNPVVGDVRKEYLTVGAGSRSLGEYESIREFDGFGCGINESPKSARRFLPMREKRGGKEGEAKLQCLDHDI